MNEATFRAQLDDLLMARAQPRRMRAYAVQWRPDTEDQFPRVMRVLAADEGEARDMLEQTLGRTDFTLVPVAHGT